MPIVSYNYTKTIPSSIFNHIKIVSEFELDRFMENGYPCDCQNSLFLSGYHGHVITGNLSIVSNEALRGLNSKGPNSVNKSK